MSTVTGECTVVKQSIRRTGYRRALRIVAAALFAGGPLLVSPPDAPAQQPEGRVHGRIVAAEGGALVSVRVYIDGTTRGTLTDELGRFRLGDIPYGERVLVVQYPGYRTERLPISVAPGEELTLELRLEPQAVQLVGVVVTATREAQDLARTPATVGVIESAAIRIARPTHPSEIMGKIPGVWVNVTGGEGHMTAIRQPLSTDPVYLFLEDGVPTRSTGFFNHNALYEINLPQAERVEVVKGPATALYGSDAIGGTINVQTRPAVSRPGLEATAEAGANGFLRLLGSHAFTTRRDGVRADLNLTRTDGWREGTAYERRAATLRWDRELPAGQTLKTVATISRVDQQTAGSSRLPEDAFLNTPTLNLTPISYRDVSAARLSVEYARPGDRSLLTITPFARHNAMEILPNWSLTYDPSIWETSNRSLGALAKYRRDFEPLDTRMILGLDVDWSPGAYFERQLSPSRSGDVFTGYTAGDVLYDYDVTFTGVSPYLHAEASLGARVRVTTGVRFDRFGYAYENHLGVLQTGPHRRPESTRVSFTRLSPKLGATYDLGSGVGLFASYSQGFRAPSEGQLFRQGVAASTVQLRPVSATSYEAGLRGSVGGRIRYELAAYALSKANDILNFQRADDVRETQNAGETSHRGVEIGIGLQLPADLTLQTAFSYARHRYEEWEPDAVTDYSGNEIESAPRTLASTSLTWAPGVAAPRIALEWVHLGGYWLDARNTERYEGHDLLNLNVNWPVSRTVSLFGKLNNLTSERYAESAGWSAFRGREFAPGLPRTLYLGAELTPGWSR